MPGYPLSSNLLALFSGSFYGTPGPPTRKESAANGPTEPTTEQQGEKEARRFEERHQPLLQQPEEEEEGEGRRGRNRRRRRRRRRGSGGERRRWSTKMAAARSSPGQDKPLCPCRGPGAKGSPRFGLIFRESRYHILLVAPLPLLPPLGPFGLSLIFCSLTFRPPPRPPPPSLDCSSLWRGREGPALSLDASLWMNIARQPSLSRLLCTDVLIMSTSRNTLCKYHIYAVEGGSLETVQGGERPTGRKFLIFSLWGREPSGRFFRFNRNEAYRSIFQSYNWSSYLDDLIVQSKKHGLGSDGFPISKRRMYIELGSEKKKLRVN